MIVYRFKISVNCFLPHNDLNSDFQQDAEELYEDNGFIILPEQYSETGAPTRLVVNCHGAGGTVTTDDSQTEHQVLTQYLVANGYAVMDVNGLPEAYAKKYGIDIRNNIGSPIAIRSYVKAYHYCMEHFNLKPDVFVHGGSMGGDQQHEFGIERLHSCHCAQCVLSGFGYLQRNISTSVERWAAQTCHGKNIRF